MFCNTYDNESATWSPQGRLYQVDYAMESVKLGTAIVGLKSRDYAVLVALHPRSSDFPLSQRKVITIDEHVGIAIAGLTADGILLGRYLREQCLSFKYAYDTNYPVKRLVSLLGDKMQINTQRYDKRPYGVGLLVAGYDHLGPQIYQVMPSASFFNCKAMSIGLRSQFARVYLERNLAALNDCSKDELIYHGILAIRATMMLNEEPSVDDNEQIDDKKVEIGDTNKESPIINISIGIVAKNEKFAILDEEATKSYLKMVIEKETKLLIQKCADDAAEDDSSEETEEPGLAPAEGDSGVSVKKSK